MPRNNWKRLGRKAANCSKKHAYKVYVAETEIADGNCDEFRKGDVVYWDTLSFENSKMDGHHIDYGNWLCDDGGYWLRGKVRQISYVFCDHESRRRAIIPSVSKYDGVYDDERYKPEWVKEYKPRGYIVELEDCESGAKKDDVRFVAGNLRYKILSRKKRSAALVEISKHAGPHVDIPGRVVFKGRRYAVRMIGRNVGHDGITSVTVPDSVYWIDNEAFYDYGCRHSRLDSVTLGRNVEHIGCRAFASCKLRALTIPDSAVRIGWQAFAFNDNLETLYLGRGIGFIDDGAFCDCGSLQSICIAARNPYIHPEAFSECHSLKDIYPAAADIRINPEVFGPAAQDK